MAANLNNNYSHSWSFPFDRRILAATTRWSEPQSAGNVVASTCRWSSATVVFRGLAAKWPNADLQSPWLELKCLQKSPFSQHSAVIPHCHPGQVAAANQPEATLWIVVCAMSKISAAFVVQSTKTFIFSQLLTLLLERITLSSLGSGGFRLYIGPFSYADLVCSSSLSSQTHPARGRESGRDRCLPCFNQQLLDSV